MGLQGRRCFYVLSSRLEIHTISALGGLSQPSSESVILSIDVDCVVGDSIFNGHAPSYATELASMKFKLGYQLLKGVLLPH